MKLAGALLLTVMLLASPSRSASSQTSPVRVVVNGQDVSLAAPPILHGGVLMVPLPGLFEPFGSSAVWLPDEKAILISNRTRIVIRMRVNDPYAHVGTEPRLLPIAPVLLREIPFIPAQAVFGLLGAFVRFEEEERVLRVSSIVSAVSVQRAAGTVRLIARASGPVQAETRHFTSPERVVIDLRDAVFRLPDQETAVGEGGVSRVRIAQFQSRPAITRIVLDLSQPVDVRVADSATSFDLTLEVRPRAPGARPAAAVAPAAQPNPAPTPPGGSDPGTPPASAPPGSGADSLKIMQVRVEQTGGTIKVLVEGTATMQYVVRELVDPERLVVDIMDAIFIPVKQEIPLTSAVVENVRAAQFQADPDIMRVVVVLRRKAAYTVSPSAENGNTLVIDIPDPSLRGHVVAIDAGHGGRDMGAIGPTGLQEKDLVLDIAQRLREILVRAGVRVVMTRETDTYVDLAERPRTARQQGATVFVSIHGNASTRPAISGSETYYLTPQSLALAQMIQDELAKVGGLASRGVKTANFLVLRENDVPAVLVEVGYVSNLEEETRLRGEAFRQRITEAIMRGVQRFLFVYPVPAN